MCGHREEAPVVKHSWAERSRCAVRIAGGMMRAAPVPLGAPELHGAVAIVRLWLRLPSPPLTAGSFPATIFFEMVASADCSARSYIFARRSGGNADRTLKRNAASRA